MRNDNLPFVRINDSVENLLIKMSDGKSEIALIGSPDNLIGVITDGDLRRGLLKFNGPLKNLKISNFLTDDPVIVNVDDSVNDVEELMLKKKISTILVKDLDNIVGTYQIFD